MSLADSSFSQELLKHSVHVLGHSLAERKNGGHSEFPQTETLVTTSQPQPGSLLQGTWERLPEPPGHLPDSIPTMFLQSL